MSEARKALEIIIDRGIEKEEYFEAFCVELEKLGVDESKDYGELFEQALLEKELV